MVGGVHQGRQRQVAILVTLALGLGLLGLSLRIPVSANLPNSTFNTGDGLETGWATAPNLVTLPDVASGSGDDSLNADEDDPTPLYSVGNVQGNKADITKIRVAHERVSGIVPVAPATATAKDFLYLAWNRPADPSGNVDFDFELNKLAQPKLPSPGADWALNRSSGDLLLTFELLQGGTAPQISLRRWTTTGPCDSNPAAPCWSREQVLTTATVPAAEGSVNAGNDIVFGEMAIDLGLAGVFTPGQCSSFASVYAKSRSSGASFNSQISDLVAPHGTRVTNCGSITVTKAVDGPVVTGDQVDFGFTVDCGAVDLNGVATLGDDLTFSLAAGGSRVVPDIPVGTSCSVTEAPPAPGAHWATSHRVNGGAVVATRVASIPSVPLSPTQTAAFTNVRQTGGLTVSKVSNVDGTFHFIVDCAGTAFDRTGADGTSKVTLTTSGAAAATETLTGIPLGTSCTVTEEANSLFSSTVTSASDTVTITSSTQTIAFSNSRKTASLTIDKTTTGGTAGDTFRFAVDCSDNAFDRLGAAKLSITDSGTAQVTNIPTGTSCTVTEDVDSRFTSGLKAPSTTNTVTIPDGGATVFFENVRKTGTLTVAKTTSGGTGTFTFEVECDGTAFDRKGAQSLTITDSGSATVVGIPTGTTCVVTETSDARFTSTRTPTNGTVVMTEAGQTVSFTNVRNTGPLTITKTTTGGSGTFEFTVDCSDDRFDVTRQITDTNSATVLDIPTGTVCTVTETADPRFTSTRSPANGQRTIDADGETVAFTNARKVGSLKVEKVTTGGTGTFRFVVDCDGTAHDRTGRDGTTKVSITDSGSETIGQIPTGTSCTVTEDADPRFTSTRTSASDTVVVSDTAVQTVAFRNVRKVADLTVNKVTTGGTGTFRFAVDCDGTVHDRDGNGKLAIDTNGSATVTGIPTGTSCTVTEDADPGYASTRTPSTGTVTITDSGATVDFTNTRRVGSLTVNKVTTGGTGTFRFAVDCSDDRFDRTGAAKLAITTSGSARLDGVPTGTSCTVTEDADPLFTSTRSPANGTVTITEAGVAVDFTNVRNTGTLTVAKTTTGGTGTFRFAVDCSDDRFDRLGNDRLTITDSGTATVTGIPTTVTCTVTETDDPAFTSTRSPADGTVTIDSDGEQVAFANARNVGNLTVVKTTTGGTGTFLFAVDCSDDRFDRTGTKKLSITGSGTRTVEAIPTGTTCTVTEDADPLFTSTRTPTTGLVTVDTDGETVAFTNVRQTGNLTVVKTTTGGTGTFRFAVDCSDDRFDRLGDDRLTITGSGSATVDGIPTTVTCTVTETTDGRFTSTRTPGDGQVTMDADGEQVAFTNVRNTGSLTIAKSTTGGDGTFRFAVDCSDDRFDRTAVDVLTTNGSGSSPAIVAIPTQTTCSVTETVPAGWAAVGAVTKDVVVNGAETVAFANRRLPSGIAVTKAASAPIVRAGSTVSYAYRVTNTGEVPLTSVVVVDDRCAPLTRSGGDTDGDDALDLAETWSYTCASVLGSTTTNVATATAVDPLGATPRATADATVEVINPVIAIDKTPSAESVEPGTTVVYTFTVTNPGDVPLSAVSVADDKCAPVTLVRGDTNLDALLQPGESWVFQCSQVQTGNVNTLTNVGTARGLDVLGLQVVARDTVTVSVVAPAVLVRPAPETPVAPNIITSPLTLPRTGADTRGLLQLAGSLILLGVSLLAATPQIRRRGSAGR